MTPPSLQVGPRWVRFPGSAQGNGRGVQFPQRVLRIAKRETIVRLLRMRMIVILCGIVGIAAAIAMGAMYFPIFAGVGVGVGLGGILLGAFGLVVGAKTGGSGSGAAFGQFALMAISGMVLVVSLIIAISSLVGYILG